MTTTSFSESLKYGGRLFGFFLGILLVAGAFLGLGGYLTATEVQALLGSGAVETAPLAGGLVLTVLGLTTLIIGQFAMAYKLVADGVSRGTANAQAVVEVDGEEQSDAEASEQDSPEKSELGPSPGEQTARDHGPEQTVPSGVDHEQPAPDPEEQPPVEPDSGETPAEASGPSQSATVTQPSAGSSAESDGEQGPTDQQPAQAGREQTAEEIAFGSGDSRERTREGEQPERAPEAEPPADEQETVASVEETPPEDIETAGNSSSDPLGDEFDDE